MRDKELKITTVGTPFLLYGGSDQKVHVKVLVHNETIWLSQKLMSELFQTSTDNISVHLKNIYIEGELLELSTTEDFSVVQNEGGLTVAKNYLLEPEIKKLERTASSFFDYIENLIENRTQMTMESMAESVDKFLTFNEYKLLPNKGTINKAEADQKALAEYKIFNKTQKIESDFDKAIKGIIKV